MHAQKILLMVVAASGICLLAGCGQPAEGQTQAISQPVSEAAPDQELADLPTVIPTSEPIATTGPDATPEPTATPEPFRTPWPSPTLEPTATPTPAGSPPVRVVIEGIGLNLPLVSVGLDSAGVPIVPNHDAAWYNLSANPGTGDNVVLWGHVLRFQYAPDIPAPFARVKELGIGAPITVYDGAGEAHTYVVSQQVWAEPHEVDYILPQDSERLTLVSCIGDQVIANGSVVNMTHRLITIATPAE